jgi:ABC-type polysaccharide/polyol phosphate export permease
MLVFRDIRIRYKQAIMGFMWALFMPIVAVAAGILIKSAMAIISGGSIHLKDVMSVSVKVLPWTFFISSIKFSVQSLIGNHDLVTKIYFPREVLTLSAIIACLFDFSIAIVTLSIILAFTKIGVSIYLLWVPVILIFLILFTTGLGLILASANLFFRDIKYVVEIILTFGIFFTPVFYEASRFGKYKALLLLNPIGGILEALNSAVVLHTMPDIGWTLYAGIVSVLVFISGFAIFHRSEPYFAESI